MTYPQDPYRPQQEWPQQPPQGWPQQQPAAPQWQPPSGPQHGQSRPARRKMLTVILGAAGAFVVLLIGVAIGASGKQAAASPGPTVTVVQHDPGAASTVTVTATPTANAQGEATQISDDGVYVVGQDIPGGTWHTSGGSQCYEATLSGTDTIHDIISNNNFSGPSTVSLSGAKAFDISGGCTWRHEG